jgi:hypothetical protein
MSRRVIPGNAQPVTVLVFGPDRFSYQAAGLGVVTNTRSPASSGTNYSGDRGYGTNRWAGAIPNPLQSFGTAIVKVSLPQAQGLGLGSGVSGQPGLPSTGQLTALNALTAMSVPPGGRPGLGG